jgi:hypothetical protein
LCIAAIAIVWAPSTALPISAQSGHGVGVTA